MASKSALFVALLFIATASMANAVIVDGTSFIVSGILDCLGAPIPDITVYLALSANQDPVASAVTTASGSFTIDFLSQILVTLDTAEAFVYAESPVGNCASYTLLYTKIVASLIFDKKENGVVRLTTGAFVYPK